MLPTRVRPLPPPEHWLVLSPVPQRWSQYKCGAMCRPGCLLLLLLGTWAQAAAADPWLQLSCGCGWPPPSPVLCLRLEPVVRWGGGRAMISARTHCTGLTWCYATAVCRVVPLAVHGAHVGPLSLWCTEAVWCRPGTRTLWGPKGGNQCPSGPRKSKYKRIS